jgi:hypothetical protein
MMCVVLPESADAAGGCLPSEGAELMIGMGTIVVYLGGMASVRSNGRTTRIASTTSWRPLEIKVVHPRRFEKWRVHSMRLSSNIKSFSLHGIDTGEVLTGGMDKGGSEK